MGLTHSRIDYVMGAAGSQVLKKVHDEYICVICHLIVSDLQDLCNVN
jgi:hypothetical protein